MDDAAIGRGWSEDRLDRWPPDARRQVREALHLVPIADERAQIYATQTRVQFAGGPDSARAVPTVGDRQSDPP